MTSNVPQLRSAKPPGQNLNIVHLIPLPVDTPFGNLSLKYLLILQRLDHVNRLIRRVFASYESGKADPLGRIEVTQHLLDAEEAVYWLRKTADELIALVALLDERKRTGAYPTRVDAFPITTLLASQQPPPWVSGHLDFLRLLSEVSNAFKHSFINSDLALMGRDEPGVYALGLKWNDLGKHKPKFYNIRVRELVERFDAFLGTAIAELRACSLPREEPAASA